MSGTSCDQLPGAVAGLVGNGISLPTGSAIIAQLPDPIGQLAQLIPPTIPTTPGGAATLFAIGNTVGGQLLGYLPPVTTQLTFGLIGPGGLLIGNGLDNTATTGNLNGGNGGLLIGNGGNSLNGNGGNAGLLFGNGGNHVNPMNQRIWRPCGHDR